MNRTLPIFVAALTSLILPGSATGATITLGTSGNAANWLITGGGATAVPAFQTSANHAGEISPTSTAFGNGSFLSGGSLAAFNGLWFADRTFTLPGNAFGISLNFDSLYGNDRVVLELNGTIIGNADHLGATGAGVMSFPSGPVNMPFTFTGTTSGTATSGFLSGMNTLRIIVNNTGVAPISAPTATFANAGDATDAFLNATVFYTVPEPSTAVLGIIALAGLMFRRSRGFRDAAFQRPLELVIVRSSASGYGAAAMQTTNTHSKVVGTPWLRDSPTPGTVCTGFASEVARLPWRGSGFTAS